MKTTITCCSCKTLNINTTADTKYNIIFVYHNNSTIYYSVRIGQLADDGGISSAKIVKPQITSCLMAL